MGTPSSPARARHWDQVYDTKGAEQVSWFQPEPTVSLELIDGLHLDPDSSVIDVGGGASSLVDRLLDRGHTDITVLDVSAHALELVQHRLGDRAAHVRWEVADVLQWTAGRRFELWHDRAVFHFLTSSAEQARYCELASSSIAADGYLIVATFAADGPEHCSGLPVTRHSPADLTEHFGTGFTTVATRREHHHTPTGGQQPFTWLLARHHSPRRADQR